MTGAKLVPVPVVVQYAPVILKDNVCSCSPPNTTPPI
jgi:hypothetical protein